MFVSNRMSTFLAFAVGLLLFYLPHVFSLTIDHTRRTAVASAVWIVPGTVSTLMLLQPPPPALAENLSTFVDGPRGIRYKILQEGQGDPPVRAQQIKAKYTLWTGGFGEDGGKQVDSNASGLLSRPLPVIVGVGRVIKGWDLTLLQMRKGEIRRIVVPPELGYGDRGAGGAIPPKATLYFEIEITDIDPMIELNDQQKQWLEEHPL
jgi:FKBP-type peptidyl-prolyl cis-trans isomerase